MKIKNIVDEDFVNYKIPSMFIGLGTCNWKCCKEANIPIETCQNSELSQQKSVDISTEQLFRRYISNPISKAVVIGGLEPITEWDNISELISVFRNHNCNDDFVIYTGHTKEEIKHIVTFCQSNFSNIIFKFGRYKPNQDRHYDNVLGVYLVSDNQYGEVIC